MTNDELQALCDAATPGPWYSHNPDDEMHMNAYAVSTSPIEPCVDTDERINDRAIIVAITLLQTPRVACTSDGRYEQNAAFIAAARTAIPELLAALARQLGYHHAYLLRCIKDGWMRGKTWQRCAGGTWYVLEQTSYPPLTTRERIAA